MTARSAKEKPEKTISLSNIVQYSLANNFMFPHNGNKEHVENSI